MTRRGEPHPLLSAGAREALEQLVSRQEGRDWRVKSFEDLHDLSSHPAAILSDGRRAVFAKLSTAANGLDQFEAEAAGLRLLSERAGIRTPGLVGIAPAPGGWLLVLEAVEAVERGAGEWREIGRTLARIHRVRGERCGLETQGYFGALYQDNRPMADWMDFFRERRLWMRLMEAIDSGHLPSEMIRKVERLIARLPGLDIPESEPRLLHGDAQQNNFISTAAGAAAVDPAVFYGHPEVDLAHVDYFEAVPEDVFEGYREILAVAPGFEERRELWRIPTHLGIVSVGALEYLPRLEEALKLYL